MSRSLLSELNAQLAHPKPDCEKERAARKTARLQSRRGFRDQVMREAMWQCENIICMSVLKHVHDRLHAHHIIYRSDGGNDTVENGIALCPTCHDRAHNGFDDPVDDRLSGRRWMLKILDIIKAKHPERFRWNNGTYLELKRIVENKEQVSPK